MLLLFSVKSVRRRAFTYFSPKSIFLKLKGGYSMSFLTGEVQVSTVTDILSMLKTVLTSVIEWMGSMLNFFTSNPIILVPMLMFFVAGGVIGLVTRVFRN